MALYDLAGYDRDGQLALVVEVKRRPHTTGEWAAAFRRNLLAHGDPPRARLFALIVPDRIYTWRVGAPAEAAPDAEIDARPLFESYFERAHADPEQIDPMAFELLVAWWLQDMARADHEVVDPNLERSGLLRALAGGRIVREAAA
jgi:hypothetical protein